MTSNNTTSAYPVSYSEDYITTVVNNLDYYLVPVVIGIGLLGNTLSFMVFVFTNLKTLSSSVYLAALSISDSGFLICVFFSWVSTTMLEFTMNKDGARHLCIWHMSSVSCQSGEDFFT